MYLVKQRIYLYFDKTQKSMLCTFLRAFVKQHLEDSCADILDKFIDEQEYYIKVNACRFPYIEEYLSDDMFLHETLEFIKACKKYYDYKKAQAPLIAKQKEFEKQKRKFLQEIKMSKEAPTKKQLYYYNRLCKKYNIEKKDTNTLSKLDLRNKDYSMVDLDDKNNYNEDKVNTEDNSVFNKVFGYFFDN